MKNLPFFYFFYFFRTKNRIGFEKWCKSAPLLVQKCTTTGAEMHHPDPWFSCHNGGKWCKSAPPWDQYFGIAYTPCSPVDSM